METFAEALAELRDPDAGGFNYSPERAATLLNEGVRRLASRSEWIRTELEIGPVVAGQEVYDLPANIVRMREVLSLLDGAYGRYTRVSLDDVLGIKSGRLTIVEQVDVAGVFAERFDGEGIQKQISVLPVPEAAGATLLGLASIWPAKKLEGEDPLPFPPDFNRAIVDYAKGISYENTDENAQSGSYFIGRGDSSAAELRLLAKSRTGQGPYRIPVAGHRR